MINKQRLILLTRKLIRINSENPPGKEARIAGFARDYLKAFGLKPRIYEFTKGRPNLTALLKSDNPKAKTILISPHLDTVPAGRGWKFPPFKGVVKNGRIYGRGATDCKCNLAAAIEVLHSFIERKVRLKNNILFAATADEENGSEQGLIPLLKNDLLKADYALILDSDEFDIITAQKGLIHFKVMVYGRKAHGAYPWLGLNAINISSRIIQDLGAYKFRCRKHPLLRAPTMNIGTIKGGDKVNMVADWCEFEVDLRFLPGMALEPVMRDIKKIISRNVKKASLNRKAARISGRWEIRVDGLQDPYEIHRSHNLVTSLLKTWKSHFPKARIKGSQGATVITFFKDMGIPAVATGFGSAGCAHINDEFVKIDNICRGASALAEFLGKELK